MTLKEILSKGLTKKIIAIILLLGFALVSFFVISKPATNPETYRATIQSIDDKKATIAGVTTSAAVLSTALALVPDDVTTPIANQILEISAYLLIVVCVLVLEKSLLTVMGYLSFNLLIPISCVLFGIYTFVKKEKLKAIAIKLIVFALVIVTIIPFSIKISDLIYDVNKSTITQLTEEVDKTVEEQEDKSLWDTITDGVDTIKETLKNLLNAFIDTVAMFIIVYCVVPICVIFLVAWLIKFLFGIALPTPNIQKLQKKTANLLKIKQKEPEEVSP